MKAWHKVAVALAALMIVALFGMAIGSHTLFGHGVR